MKEQSKRNILNFLNIGQMPADKHREMPQKNTDNDINKIKSNINVLYFIAIVLVFIALMITFNSMSRQNASQFSRCNSILLKSYRMSCFASLAAYTKNTSMCTYTVNKSACIENIAEESNNSVYCKSLENLSAQNSCILAVSIKTNNSALCNSMSGPNKSECVFYFAKLQNFKAVSLGECNNMTNSSEIRICTDLFYYRTMLSSKNSSYCSHLPARQNLTVMSYMLNASTLLNSGEYNSLNKISNTSLAKNTSKINSSIFSSLQPAINQESTLMGFISANITPQNLCYYESALNSHNASYCRFAGNLSLQCSSAFENITQSSKEYNNTNFTDLLNQCNNLPYSNLTTLCKIGLYSQYAVIEKNVSYCLESGNQSIENLCISNMAEQINNSYYCSYLTNSTLRFDCEAPFNLSITK